MTNDVLENVEGNEGNIVKRKAADVMVSKIVKLSDKEVIPHEEPPTQV